LKDFTVAITVEQAAQAGNVAFQLLHVTAEDVSHVQPAVERTYGPFKVEILAIFEGKLRNLVGR
jgi:hypothetical protein